MRILSVLVGLVLLLKQQHSVNADEPATEPPVETPVDPTEPPAVPPPTECTLCTNGDPLPNPLAVTDAGIPCAALLAGAGANDPPPDLNCLGLQFVGFTQCGCPSPPLASGEPCYLCGAPDVTFNSEKELVNVTLPNVPLPVRTCGELNELAQIFGLSLGEGTCSPWEVLGAFCECEGAELPCPLCPDGSRVPDPDLEISGPFLEESITCGEVEEAASLLGPLDVEECLPLQALAFACQCESATAPCTLCPLGEDPTLPEVMIPELAVTCQEAADAAATVFFKEICSDLQLAGTLLCGCEVPATGPCGSLCPDGLPSPTPDAIGFVDDTLGEVTCGTLETVLSTFPEDSCDKLTFLGTNVCACGGEGSPVSCPLCEDGSLLTDPNLKVSGSDSCVDLAFDSKDLDPASADCSAIQATAGFYCGCGNQIVSESACRLCGEGVALPDPAKEIFIPALGDTYSCQELEFLANNGTFVCDDARTLYSLFCCPGNYPSCNICGHPESVVTNNMTAFNTTRGSFTCEQVFDAGVEGALSEQDCDDTQGFAVLCGCTDVVSPTMPPTPASPTTPFPTPEPPTPTEAPSTSSAVGLKLASVAFMVVASFPILSL